MEINSNNVDIVLLRKKRKRRRRLAKLLAFAVFAGLVITLVVKRDSWIPRLEGIGGKFHSVRSSGELAGGNFPLSISGGIDYQTAKLDDSLVILSDAYL